MYIKCVVIDVSESNKVFGMAVLAALSVVETVAESAPESLSGVFFHKRKDRHFSQLDFFVHFSPFAPFASLGPGLVRDLASSLRWLLLLITFCLFV